MANPKIEISNRFKATRPKHMYGKNPRFWVKHYEQVAARGVGPCVAVFGMVMAGFGVALAISAAISWVLTWAA